MMKMNKALCAAATLFIFGACGGEGETEEGVQKEGVNIGAFADDSGKGDLAKSTKVIDNMKPDSEVKGKFSRKVRTYGYIVDARKGAELTIDLSTVTGSDADAAGTSLDTMYVIHGPYKSAKEPGPKLFEADDTDDQNLNPPSTSFKVEEDGKYFIAFTSYEDTGEKSTYDLNISCKGTDLQCSLPSATKACKNGELYIQGNSIEKSQTWDKCDVIVLENVTIQEDATVTIKPGVTVRNNFIQGTGDGFFGEVGINVNGTLQADGTDKNPIIFTNFVEEQGWAGLVFNSKSNSVKHAFIENVHTGVEVMANASANLDHLVIEGDPALNTEEPDRPTLINALRRSRAIGGVVVGQDGEAKVTHSLIKKFRTGVQVNNSTLVTIQDSVIRYNRNGVHVVGVGGQNRTQCNTRAPAPPARFIDPKIDHTDIMDNGDYGFLLQQDGVFIQVQKSNIVDNGREGIILQGGGLTEDSFIRENNIFHNNGSTKDASSFQVSTFHASGSIDLSNNYWEFISDPFLSQTRQTCNNAAAPVIYTGFSPKLIEDAGPRDVTEIVAQDSFEQVKQK
jgi:hypothetical protein